MAWRLASSPPPRTPDAVVGASERGRAAGATPDDEHDVPDGTPTRADPLPPGFLDLGGGELFGCGTAADCRAAAEWLARNYPERSQDPPHGQMGPVYNMGYELTREARAGMPRWWSMGQRALVLILADICNDRTRRPPARMDVSPQLLEELGGITPGGLRNILTSLAADGLEFRVAVGKDKRGLPVFAHRGHAVDYQFPEMPPRIPKGALTDAPLSPSAPSEGASVDAPSESEGASVDGPLGPKAHPSMLKGASVDAPLTTVTPQSKEDAPAAAAQLAQDQSQDQGQNRRVGDGVDDKAQPVYAGTGPKSNPLANSQNRRVHQGPETVADDAQEFPFHDAESATAGSCARVSEAARGSRWRSPQEIAAEQAAESRAARRQAGAAS